MDVGALDDKNGPIRYMVFGWYIVTFAMLAAGYVAYSISDAILAAYCIIVILGIFQFAIAAAQKAHCRPARISVLQRATCSRAGSDSSCLFAGSLSCWR